MYSLCWPVVCLQRSVAIPALLCALLVGCQRPPETDAPVLAMVDGQPITEAAFRYWWEQERPENDTPAMRETILAKMIARASVVQRAKEAGLHQDPEVIEEFNSLLVAKLREQELQQAQATITVSEDEAASHYQKHQKERYTSPARKRFAVLWLNSRGQDALAEQYVSRLEPVREALETDAEIEGFGNFAISNTEHRASRFKGGDVGWFETGQSWTDPWRTAVAEIGASLTGVGECSAIVTREEGVFLLRLTDEAPSRVQELVDVREQIVQELTRTKRLQLERDFNQLAEDSTIQRNDDLLAGLNLSVFP